MQSQEAKSLRLNYIVNTLDGAFFGWGIGFASFTTVIPLFVHTMTSEALLIGLITSVHVMGWQIPQLFMAKSVSRLKRYKPMVMWMTIHERVPFLGLALIALFYRQLGPTPAIVLTFLMLSWQGLGAGFTANSWQNMIGKVIPPEYLATFFGVQSSAANLLSSVGAVIAGLLLERQPFPLNYVLCFTICFVMLAMSYIAISFTKESERQMEILAEDQPRLWHSILEIMRRDRNFDWFLVARTIVQFGTMAFSFYTVYAVSKLSGTDFSVGLLTAVSMFTQVLTNLLLGWLADRWSRKGVLEIGALSIFLSAIIARFAPTFEWMYLAIILSAMANTAFWTITMAMTLQFGSSDHDRPTYVGMANTFIAPATIVAPLLGGWLADTAGYPSTFLLAAVAGLLAAAIFHFFIKDPKNTVATAASEASETSLS